MSTISSYTGDGSTRQFDITFEYRLSDAVKVRVDGVDVDFSFVSASRVETSSPPASGAAVELYRETSVEEAERVFSDTQILHGSDLNAGLAQPRERAEELGSEIAALDGRVVKYPGTAAERAGKFAAFDAEGNEVAASGTGADDALRGDIAEETGAALVGTSTGASVQTALDSLSDLIAAFPSRDLSPFIIDMHWSAMLGQGWVAGDPGDGASQKGTTLAAGFAAGATSATVVDGTPFANGQLIVYQGTDTKWHTVRIASKAGAVLTFDREAPAAASLGANIGVFFNDHNHPREWGSYAIADLAVDEIADGLKRELLYAQRSYDEWEAWNTATLSAVAALDYQNPGSDVTALQALQVDSSTQYSGARSLPFFGPQGTYEVELTVNPGNVGGARNTVLVFVEEEFNGTTTIVPTSVSVTGLSGVQKVRLRFAKSNASRVRIYAQGQLAGTFTFSMGPIRWYRVTGALTDLSVGTWVGLGDSWFQNPWILDRIETRLPNITLVRKGVTGNTASDLLARFDTDVVPFNPRVVLINCSTNDWAAAISRFEFASRIQELIRRCQAIGAQPILFSPTVGDAASGGQLTKSREYAAALEYEVQGPGDRHTVVSAQRTDKVTLAANGSAGDRVVLYVSPVAVNRGVILDRLAYSTPNAAVQIRMGYSAVYTPPAGAALLGNELAFGAAGAVELKNLLVSRTPDTNTRFFMVTAINTDAGGTHDLDYCLLQARLADLLAA